MSGPDLSPEAKEFLSSWVSDITPTDFSSIEKIREKITAVQSPAAERAIKRHRLKREEWTINGIRCDRVVASDNTDPAGILLYFFGGGFISGSPYDDLPIIGALAEYCSLEVIAPWYRLAPEHPAPAAADDCMTVYEHLAQEQTQALFLAGESAGGNLALLIAQQSAARQLPPAKALALLSPAVDLRTDTQLFEPTTNADPTLHPERIAEIAAVYAPGRDLAEPALSPLFGTLQNIPPTFITTGTRDLLLGMCLRLHRQLLRSGVEAECRVWDGLWHVFEYYDKYPEASESLQEIARFINSKK